MKNRLHIALVVLLAAMLACRGISEPGQFSSTDIISVTVSPQAGTGSFKLSVTVKAEVSEGSTPENVHCYYVTPDGATMEIGQYSPTRLPLLPSLQPPAQTMEIHFSVRPEKGIIQPGSYLAGCTNDRNSSMKTTTFRVVTGEATITPTLPGPQPTLAPTQASQFLSSPLKGKFIFDYAAIRVTAANVDDRFGSAADLLSNLVDAMCGTKTDRWQSPEITITPDGKLSNTTCREGFDPPGFLTISTFTYQVNGTVDASGNVQFTLEIYQYGPEFEGTPDGVYHLVINGQGKFTTPTQAAGTASFTFNCDNNSGMNTQSSACGSDNDSLRAHSSVSGEIPWKFEAMP